MSSAMMDMMFMILILGGAYWLYSTGKLDELFGSGGGGGGGGGMTSLSYSYAGDSWSSATWVKTQKTVKTVRSQKIDWVDKADKRVCMVAVGDGGYKTNSDGTFDMTGTSPRMTIGGNWTNVEESVYFYNTGKGNIDLRPKTDHYCFAKSKFGGYIVNLDMAAGSINVRKELAHSLKVAYSDRINKKTVTLPKNAWIGLRGVCYNIGNGVKVEAYLDTGSGFKKVSEGLDDGKWLGKPHTAACGGSAIRVNTGGTSMRFKNWTVRGISMIGGQKGPQQPKQSAVVTTTSNVGWVIPNVGTIPTYYTDGLGFQQWEDDEDGRIIPR